jgi:murein L,D-transpeptidase YcbB/YkuD
MGSMKKMFVFVPLAALLLAACDNMTETNALNSPKSRKISSRNLAINRSNAYNDLFLDSTTVENFITEQKIPDSISFRMRSFYNSRNFEFAWFSSEGLTEQARGFWNLYNNHLSTTDDTVLRNKDFMKRMKSLVAKDTIYPSAKNKNYVAAELLLTSQFIRHTLVAYDKDYVKRKEMERFIPAQKLDPVYLADSLLNKKHKDEKYYENVNPTYGLLKEKLKAYVTIQKQGGWPLLKPSRKPMKKGTSSPMVALLKKRLQLTGDYSANDTSQVFDERLEESVKHFQERHGLTPDGIVSEGTIAEMNVPVKKRIEQLLINMDRMRWLPREYDGRFILVNIPAFKLHLMENKNEIFDMDVVVGKEGNNTRIFTGDLNQVVFNPYWNVPQSIVEKEIVPAMEKDPDYLEKENMEITGNDEEGVPVVRQLPGEKNALGRIKFLFPNSFDIYFHDTPAKSLFKKEKRAFSHGCIRLSEPVKLAAYLLKDQGWTEQKIEDAMNRDDEKFVKLKDAVPVLITYYTAWVDDNGQLNFREDIYDHDADMARKMFL